MKKQMYVVFILLITVSSCKIEDDIINDYVTPEIRVNTSKIPFNNQLTISEEHQFEVRFFNDIGIHVPQAPITWTSSNNNIISINKDGLAKAVAAGEASISASVANVNPSTANEIITTEIATINVVNHPESLSITNLKNTLGKGETVFFLTNYVNIFGEVDTTPPLVWESTNTTVVSVDQNGKVTGLAVGTSEITVKTQNNSISFTFQLEVKEAISKIFINNLTSSPIKIGNTYQYTASYFDENGNLNTTNELIWTVDNPSIATIDNNGLLTAVNVGNTTLTVSTIENQETVGFEAEITTENNNFSIKNPVSTLGLGNMHQFEIDFLGTTAVSWFSSDANIASIDEFTGLLTTQSNGSVRVTAQTLEGGIMLTSSTEISINTPQKTGTLETLSYSVRGNVTLTSNKLTIVDFNSTAPDSHVYLTNVPNGPANDSRDLHVSKNGKITSSSLVSLELDDIDINKYKFVVITCRSFGNFVMGRAELN